MSNRILVAIALSVLGAVGCNLPATTPAHTVADVSHTDASHDGSTDDGDKGTVRQRLAAHRMQQVERLEAYAASGRFPLNLTQPNPSHQLKDAKGTYCAVANLVVEDGLGDVIDAKSQTDNALLFGDVKDGQLYSWILTSGLTQEEIAAIQAPAPYTGEGRLSGPVPIPAPIDSAKEDAATKALQAHFRAVEAQILADTDKSLDVATARVEGAYGSNALAML